MILCDMTHWGCSDICNKIGDVHVYERPKVFAAGACENAKKKKAVKSNFRRSPEEALRRSPFCVERFQDNAVSFPSRFH